MLFTLDETHAHTYIYKFCVQQRNELCSLSLSLSLSFSLSCAALSIAETPPATAPS